MTPYSHQQECLSIKVTPWIAPDNRLHYDAGFNRGLILGVAIGLWALLVYALATMRYLP